MGCCRSGAMPPQDPCGDRDYDRGQRHEQNQEKPGGPVFPVAEVEHQDPATATKVISRSAQFLMVR